MKKKDIFNVANQIGVKNGEHIIVQDEREMDKLHRHSGQTTGPLHVDAWVIKNLNGKLKANKIHSDDDRVKAGPPKAPAALQLPPKAGPPKAPAALQLPPKAGPPKAPAALQLPPKAGPPKAMVQKPLPKIPPGPGGPTSPPKAPAVKALPPKAGPPKAPVKALPPKAGPPKAPAVKALPPKAGPPKAPAVKALPPPRQVSALKPPQKSGPAAPTGPRR